MRANIMNTVIMILCILHYHNELNQSRFHMQIYFKYFKKKYSSDYTQVCNVLIIVQEGWVGGIYLDISILNDS